MKIKSKEWAPENFELENLKRWKYSSTKAKIEWLEDALEFGRAFQKNISKNKINGKR